MEDIENPNDEHAVEIDLTQVIHKIKLPTKLNVFKAKNRTAEENPILKFYEYINEAIRLENISKIQVNKVAVGYPVDDILKRFIKQYYRKKI